jgi:hypothetical protein
MAAKTHTGGCSLPPTNVQISSACNSLIRILVIIRWLNRRHEVAAFSSQRSTVFQGVPGNLLDSGDGRLVHTLDAESGNPIKHSPAMLEVVIDRAAVPAESPATTLASESSAFSPAGLVESKTNNYGQRGLGSCYALLVWAAEKFHGF